MNKKHNILSGVLVHPLTVGGQALILHEGQYILTSTIVAIHSIAPEQIVFETRNTYYFLMKPAATQAASFSLPAASAA